MQKEEIVMPKLGESVTEGTINTWLVQQGDKVQKYDPIADVMTDKVNAEVPSSHSGVISEILVQEGETIEVGEVICYIETESSTNEKAVEKAKERATPANSEETKQKEGPSMKMRYSPAVLKLSQEHGIDLATLTGSGLGGRITRKDVQQQIDEQPSTNQPAEPPTVAKESVADTGVAKGDYAYHLTGVRKTIADNMTYSQKEIPHAWLAIEVDVTDLVNYRDTIKTEFKEREGLNLTYFSFFTQALVKALKAFPKLNSVWNGEQIIQKKDINVSIAVAKDDVLFVPVIKQADHLSVTGIAKEIDRLAVKGRKGQLTAEDMANGTFTLNNTGSFGSISSMGIISYPQVAILQVESIVKRPVIIDDMFAARDIVNLSLSMDHRVLDGLICGKFLAYMKELLEGMNDQTVTI